MNYAYPLSLGAQLMDTHRTRFRLWAPGCEQVWLRLQGAEPLAMQHSGEGVFSCEAECGAGTRYQYLTDTGLAVPDPLSRCQAQDVDGHSVVVDPNSYHWRHADWRGRDWSEIVIYEIHTGCFGGTSGTFRGLMEHLEELAELGVTAIELMPIADFPGARNWGYDGVLLFAPDRAYGSPESLKELIDAAHGCGLCVYLDVVYNHFGPEGNYLGAYAPQFFTDEDSPWGAHIDFSQPRVRRFYIENALYWLMEYRFDGLRFDAVHAIRDTGWLQEAAACIRAEIEPGRHVHLMLENENNQAELLDDAAGAAGYEAQWNDDGHNVLHVLLTGETEAYYQNYAADPTGKLARCLGEGFIYQGESSPDRGEPRGTASAHLPPSAFILFLQNHDQVGNRALGERLSCLTDPARLRAAVTLQLLCPQIPLLFMGEEWGCETPFLYFTDFHGSLADAVREGRRAEFAAFSAFSDARQRCSIPDPNAESSFARSRLPTRDIMASSPLRREWREFYRKLLQLRRRHIVPRIDGCRSSGSSIVAEGCVVAAWRMGDGTRLHIAVNLSGVRVNLPRPPGRLLATSAADPADALRDATLAAAVCAVFLDDSNIPEQHFDAETER